MDNQHYTNVPFEIPESWEWVRVNDLFLLNPKNHVDDNMDVGFVPMECVKDGYSGKHFFYTKKWQEVKKGYTHFQNGDVGVAKISPCFENRKSTIFCGLPNGYGAGTTELTILRPFSVNAAYYLYVFKTAWYISEGSKNFKGNVGQQRVSKDIFSDFLIPLPPLSEQQRIVDEIERWFAVIDDLEANKQDLQAAIKQVRAKVLDLAIHGKLVPQDPTDEPASELLKRINPHYTPCDTSHYENLPKQWTICRLDNVAEVFDNIRKPIKAEERAKRIEGKINLYPYYGATGFVGYIDEYLIDGKYILLGEDGAPFLDKYSTKAYEVSGKIWVNNHAHILLPKIDFQYLLLYLNAIDYSPYAKGTTRLKLTQGDMSKILILLPPIEEQRRISNRIAEIFGILQAISAVL